jgi:xylanolytic transcriptional activator XlnR
VTEKALAPNVTVSPSLNNGLYFETNIDQGYGVPCAYTREQKKRGQKPGQKSARKRKAASNESNQRTKRRRSVATLQPKEEPVSCQTSPESTFDQAEWTWEAVSIENRQSSSLSSDNKFQHELSPYSSPEAEQMFGMQVTDDEFDLWDDLRGDASTNDIPFSFGSAFPTCEDTLGSQCQQFPEAMLQQALDPSSLHSAAMFDLGLRYPILQDILPSLVSIVSTATACTLLEAYFEKSPLAPFPSLPPFILGSIMRKKSVLVPYSPRSRSPALLASMLWMSAQSPDAMFAASPIAKQDISRKLYDLTVKLLQPRLATLGLQSSRWHPPDQGKLKETISRPSSPRHSPTNTNITTGQALQDMDALDDIITLLHLVTVASANEQSLSFVEWWDIACKIASSINLGTEISETDMQAFSTEFCSVRNSGNSEESYATGLASPPLDWPLYQKEDRGWNNESRNDTCVAETIWEYQEERRRVWWLLYVLDRHLALSFNRPISLRDSQCPNLLHPMEERIWQASRDPNQGRHQKNVECPPRRRGPVFECTGLHFAGFFLPLMTILGRIVERRTAKGGCLSKLFRTDGSFGSAELERISRMLESYERSLSDLESQLSPSSASAESVSPRFPVWAEMSDRSGELFEPTTIAAYARCVMHVLHVLLRAKWDPTSIFEDQDLWISSRSFGRAMSSALSASKAIENILVHDPGFTYMPYFIRVYLVQGSLIPLLAVETLGSDCNSSVIRACQMIVKAHEACVMTLDSEFQVCWAKAIHSLFHY